MLCKFLGFNSEYFKYDIYFHFRIPPTPARAPLGGGLGGPKGVYHEKSSDMSILGFSIVGISKMISISILGYQQPLQGRPWGGGPEGYTTKNQVMSILGFSIVGISKMISISF